MKDKKIFEEICKIETTAKCNYVDDKDKFSEALKNYKENEPTMFNKLVKLYEEYYGEDNKFWENI